MSQNVLDSPLVKRPRTAWFPFVAKLNDTYSLHIGYKSARGEFGEYSTSGRNASVKVPFGSPIKCVYKTSGEFEFINSSLDSKDFKLCELDSFLVEKFLPEGSDCFAKKISSMIVGNYENKLAMFFTLLSHCTGFDKHLEDIHNDEGESVVEENKALINEELIKEFRDFRAAAVGSARNIKRSSKDIRIYFAPKRKISARKGAIEKSKIELIDEREKVELNDADGLEKMYQNSFLGLANISLDCLSISPDLMENLNNNRVENIKISMVKRYDPSLNIPVVCPKDGQSVINLEKIENIEFMVIQKIHSVQAFKKLDAEGKFAYLIGHENRTVPCFVLRISSSGLIHYGNMRSNNITSEYSRRIGPQDLLKTYACLFSKCGADSAKKTVDRMACLSRIGVNECTALKKFFQWSEQGLSCLMQVLDKYESYETVDKKPKRYQSDLQKGLRMNLNNALFKQLSKVSENYFLQVHTKILDKDISLQSCVDTYDLIGKVETVSSVLCVLSGYKQYDDIKQEYPGKFELEQLKEFLGAKVKISGELNNEALKLEKYFKSVAEGYISDCNNSVKLVEIDDFEKTIADQKVLAKFDVIVIKFNDVRECKQVVERFLGKCTVSCIILIMFPSEECMFRTLCWSRVKLGEMTSIKPIYFKSEYEVSDDDTFDENVLHALLIGNIEPGAPLKVHLGSLDVLPSTIARISLPGSSVAVFVGADTPLFIVHSDSLGRNVTYFGLPEQVKCFRADKAKVCTVSDLLDMVEENNNPDASKVAESNIDQTFNETFNINDESSTSPFKSVASSSGMSSDSSKDAAASISTLKRKIL